VINTPPKREFLERKKTDNEDLRDTERAREREREREREKGINKTKRKAATMEDASQQKLWGPEERPTLLSLCALCETHGYRAPLRGATKKEALLPQGA